MEVLAALRLLTRLPLPFSPEHFPLHRAAAWFPLAGAVIGGLAGLAYTAAGAFWPPLVAVWAAILVEVAVTGALHLDGLADVADGLGGDSPARRLEIMADPRLGSFGAAALFLALGGRWALLASLPPTATAGALLIAHTACRWAPAWALARYPAARPGLGATFAGTRLRELAIAAATALVIAGIAAGPEGILAAAAAAGAGMGVAAWVTRRLSGITGDVCGASAEAGLLAALAILAAVR